MKHILDLMVIQDFQTKNLGEVLNEFQTFDNPVNRFVHYRQAPSFEIEVASKLPINLDGEPYRWDRIVFEIEPGALSVVLPEGCPLIQGP